jgi:hypothetical protein
MQLTPLSKNDQTAYLNVDHVFETKFLKEFFLEILRQELSPQTCADLQTFWDGINLASWEPEWKGKGSFYQQIGARDGISRFTTIFKLLAGHTVAGYADFAGTDEVLNSWKSDMFQLDFSIDRIDKNHIRGTNTPSRWMDVLNHMAAALEMMGNPDVLQAFQKTHRRLTLAFRQLNGPQCPAPEDYAARWSEWMNRRLRRSAEIISRVYNTIVDDHVKPDSLQGEDHNRWLQLNTIHPASRFTLDVPKLLQLVSNQAGQSVKIWKRQTPGGMCWRSLGSSKRPSAASASMATPSGTTTSSVTGSSTT